jgi:signal transduction histidine kinase
LEVSAGDGSVAFTVADSGPGLEPESVDRIFQYGFSTKQAASDGGTGTARRGVGLALVRQAVQRLGGKMTISNGRNGDGTGPQADSVRALGGAQFRVVLPSPNSKEDAE